MGTTSPIANPACAWAVSAIRACAARQQVINGRRLAPVLCWTLVATRGVSLLPPHARAEILTEAFHGNAFAAEESHWFRWDQTVRCPKCGGEVSRIHRRPLDRLRSLVSPVHRYRCYDLRCRWEGTLSGSGDHIQSPEARRDQKNLRTPPKNPLP